MSADNVVPIHTAAPDPDEPPLSLPYMADAEACLIGALLYQTADRAADALALVLDEDLDDPRPRRVLHLIREVVADGHAPDPTLILAAATRTGLHGGPDALSAMGSYLTNVHGAVPHPGNLDAYAFAVLDSSFLLRMDRCGMQLRQYAREGSDEERYHVIGTGYAELRAHHARRAAADPRKDRARE